MTNIDIGNIDSLRDIGIGKVMVASNFIKTWVVDGEVVYSMFALDKCLEYLTEVYEIYSSVKCAYLGEQIRKLLPEILIIIDNALSKHLNKKYELDIKKDYYLTIKDKFQLIKVIIDRF